MSYRVEYNGGDVEVATLDGALDNAKNAIASDIGPISGWTIEHDETINDWFVQGVLDGTPVGPTAVVTGPDPTGVPSSPSGRVYASGDSEDWARLVSFTGASPAEVFDKAADWFASQPSAVTLSDVSWQGGELRVYLRP